MTKYIIRLDDASEYMDVEKWERIESLLDAYNIKPIVGIIPNNKDESMTTKYKFNDQFWELVQKWINKEWTPALHGYEHRYETREGGINPVNKRSEFAGLSYDIQAEKIRNGYQILFSHYIKPDIFFAPSHTYDENTLIALKEETPIRIISDTFAFNTYKDGEFWFIPQQSGRVRKLPFHIVTFCYHPNTMSERSFLKLESFLANNNKDFIAFSKDLCRNKNKTLFDRLFQKIYYIVH